ncbi:MAG TPA: hypothetical protein VHY91_24220 [Pirellulales bacterium]|nr:hypothetical protein [Pirellulales bacterium]
MSESNEQILPPELTRYLPDSKLSVAFWDAKASVLALNIEKEIGQERGMITLSGVSRVCLPAWLEISGMECVAESRFLLDPLEAGEVLLIVYGVSWEQPFYVVAKSVRYVVTG